MSRRELRVLFIEDTDEDQQLLLREFQRGGYDVTARRVWTAGGLSDALAEEASGDLVVCDWVIPGFSAPDAIATLIEKGFDGARIVVSGSMGEDHVVEAIRTGAHDYVLKDNLYRFLPAVERELQEARNRRAVRRAEESLAASEERYRRLIETMPAATYVIANSDETEVGYIPLFASPQIERMTGFSPAELEEDPDMWLRIVHPEDVERVLAADAEHLRSGERITQEFRVVHRDGGVRWLLEIAESVGQGADRVSQGVVSDITQLKQAEEALQETVERLRETDRGRRELLSRLISAQEEERQRIAGEIHDDPVQVLYALGLRLGMLRDVLTDQEHVDALGNSEVLISEAIGRLRRMLFELQPHSLDSEGLGAALTEYLDYLNQESALTYVIEDRFSGDLSREMRTVAYRMVLESLANVRKHAEASTAIVRLSDEDGGLLGEVIDDGQGFDAGEATMWKPGHLGLPAMRERVQFAGGRLDVASTVGEGTTLTFWLPSG